MSKVPRAFAVQDLLEGEELAAGLRYYIAASSHRLRHDAITAGATYGCAVPLSATDDPPGLLELDGSNLEGGGHLVRSAFAYAAVLGQPVRVNDIRGRRKESGLRPAHVAALDAIRQLSETGVVFGGATGSSVAMFVPPVNGTGVTSCFEMAIESGIGSSTVPILQTALPVMLARSIAFNGAEVTAIFRGGTNVAPAPLSDAPSAGLFQVGAPQVDYSQLVLFPMLKRLFGLDIDLELRKRGFLRGGGEIMLRAAAPCWPLQPFELIEAGEIARVRGVAYRSAGVPKQTLCRMLKGQLGIEEAGAQVAFRARLGEDVPIDIDQLSVESVNGDDACGIVVVLETTSGCLLGGDSMCRAGAPPEGVGEEAARAALGEHDAGACADRHLVDQLIFFMVLAHGTSRLGLGTGKMTLHTRTALWLAERFGATVRLVEEGGRHVLEVEGIGSRVSEMP